MRLAKMDRPTYANFLLQLVALLGLVKLHRSHLYRVGAHLGNLVERDLAGFGHRIGRVVAIVQRTVEPDVGFGTIPVTYESGLIFGNLLFIHERSFPNPRTA